MSDKIDFTTFEYSTTKEIAVGQWIDGKTIYKKTIDFGNLPNATVKYVDTGISDIDSIIRIEGVANDTNAYVMMPLVYNTNDATYNTELSYTKSNNRIIVNTTQNRSQYTAYVTLYYTKTS